jgi:hypothetical protein
MGKKPDCRKSSIKSRETTRWSGCAVVAISGLLLWASCKVPSLPLHDEIYGYSMTVTAGKGGTIVLPTSSKVTVHGMPTIIGATAATGYIFVIWTVQSGTGVIFGGKNSPTTTVTLTNGDATIQANFVPRIETIAGSGTSGFSGEGGPAISAELNNPGAVAIDTAGNVYIADTGNNCVRRVNTLGIINTIAGNGAPGYSGDGGPACLAELNYPTGLALDSAGNLYIADSKNNRVRKVDGSGTITTFAGDGNPGRSGDGGPAASAELYSPFGLASDSAGNLYIADSVNGLIRKVDASFNITTVAGGGPGGLGDGGPATLAWLQDPVALALDASGNLYIADDDQERIRKVDATGTITTFAGGGAGDPGDGGPATWASFQSPWGIAFDSTGNLYIADQQDNRIRMVNPSGVITTVAGNGISGYFGDGEAAARAELYWPEGVAVDSGGNLYIADLINNRVRRVP